MRILSLKRRNIEKGLILIAADAYQLEPYIYYPNPTIENRVIQSWPGPVTWVLPAKPAVPYWISGYHTSVAVRISAHPEVQKLCRTVGVLVSSSANPANHHPAKTALKVRDYFYGSVDYILSGKVGPESRPTEIRDALSGTVLRRGC